MEYVSLVVIIALIEYLFFMFATGRARAQYKIHAPATSGDVNFERVFRVQANTVEQLIVFIPAIYLAGYYSHALSAAGIGSFFIIGRFVYYRAYISDASKRGPGMTIGFFSSVILMLMALVGVIQNLLE